MKLSGSLLIIAIPAVLMLTSCREMPPAGSNAGQETTADQSETVNTPEPTPAAEPEKTPENKLPAAKATPGPKANAASYGKIDGGVYYQGAFKQSHFNTVTGALSADFAPSKIVFNLGSIPAENAYPKVELRMLTPGSDWTNGWQTLATLVVGPDDVESAFDIPDAKPGKYNFRVLYNATEPTVNARPVLLIKNVELQK